MIILGVSAFYHDSAACIIKEGQVITAIEEERFSRKKHDNAFPYKAVEYCLKANNIKIDDVDYVAYYEKPLLKFERILATFVETYPHSLKPFLQAIPEWLGEKIKVESFIKNKLKFKGKVFYIPHHLSHASAAFLTSSFKKSAVLTIDGVGDIPTTGFWVGNDGKIFNLGEIKFPHSLGLLYSTFTAFLGFRVNNDEFKVMGLAAYGKPRFQKEISELILQQNDGSFELDMKYFAFRESFRMWSDKFESKFGKPRKPNDPISQRHKDLAASLQIVTESVYFKLLKILYKKTGISNLSVSGGVGLNSLANGKIYSRTKFKNIHIFGPAGDSGAAIGAALYTWTNILNKKRPKPQKHLYLGSEYDSVFIKNILDNYKLKYKEFKNNEDMVSATASLIYKNKIVGWFQGKMEFGPRALGSRSILANPKRKAMKDIVNKIKKREQFRPFAASVLQERVTELFQVPNENHYSPFMNFCFTVKDEAVNKIASIVHEDLTCRIQTVNKDNGLYYDLIKRFYKLSGIPCVLNTSFNLSHEPIVEQPENAIKDYLDTPMDALAIGNFLLTKK